jgi:hypothetical protein
MGNHGSGAGRCRRLRPGHAHSRLALGASGAVELIVLSRGVFGGAIPKNLFADILRLIAELRPPPDPAPA